MFIQRDLSTQINNNLFQDRVILIYGTRRTGKTTLIQHLSKDYQNQGKRCSIFNCEKPDIRNILSLDNMLNLEALLKDLEILILDEAQCIPNIGRILKLIHDEIPHVQVIATGSSSFDLANKTGEPLVGRSISFELQPLSIKELYTFQQQNNDSLFIQSRLEKILRFGTYPAIWNLPEHNAKRELKRIIDGYLYKDILIFEHIKHPDCLTKLLKCIALQVGSEVSFRELSQATGLAVHTVQRYLDLLKKCFIIFSLPGVKSLNLRSAIGNNNRKKFYFYDLGIRNAVISSFNPFDERNDIGALWENFCIIELMKKAQRDDLLYDHYFWKNVQQKEVDYIQRVDGKFEAYEFKYSNNRRVFVPKEFQETFKPNSFQVVHKDNFLKYMLA